MSVRNGLLGLVVAVAAFLSIGVAVTELATPSIEFSVLLGLPAGLIGGFVMGAATYRWLGSPDAGSRRIGAACSTFGVVFLGVLLALVIVVDVRNSRALPVAGVLGVVAAIAASLWFRRSDRAVPPT